jgi:hypothetical protein
VSRTSAALGVPGLRLLPEFLSAVEETGLLAAVHGAHPPRQRGEGPLASVGHEKQCFDHGSNSGTAASPPSSGVPAGAGLSDTASAEQGLSSGGEWVELAKRRVQHFGWGFDYAVGAWKCAALPAGRACCATRVTGVQLCARSQITGQCRSHYRRACSEVLCCC